MNTNSEGRVTRLELDLNEVSGSLPAEIGNLSELTLLNFSTNRLDGAIPAELGNLAKLTTLVLRNNQLSGPIPATLGDLSSLTILSLANNRLSGDIPSELGNLGDTLTNLSLAGSNNNLTGCVPYLLRNVATNDFTTLGLPICPPKATLVLTPSSITENGGTATVTAMLEGEWTADVMLTVSAAPVAPAVAANFMLNANKVLTIAMGETTSTGEVTITAVDNDAPNPDRTVTVSAVASGSVMVTAPQSVTLTITDDEEIEQRDVELMLAGAARSMASDAVDVLAGRFDASPTGAGAEMTLAGHVLRLDPQGMQEADTGTWRRTPVHGDAAWPDDRPQAAKALSAHDLLTRSSFVLALDDGEGGEGASGLTLWGRGSVSGFSSSPETGLDMEGSFRSGWLGLDYRVAPSLLVGMAVSHGTGTVDHERTGGIDAETDMTLTSVAPYAHIEAGPGLELWGLLGAGRGDMEVTVAGGSAARTTDLSSFMGAVGGRQALTSLGGIDLAARADAFASTLRSEGTASLPGASGKAQRVRVLLEGRGGAGGGMVPRFTLGGRWDGGTADTGVGLEVGGGLAWTRTGTGLVVDLQGRYLLAHTSDDYEDWGASLDLRFDPGGDGQGLMLGLSPVLGDAASGAGRLHGDADLADLAANDNRPGCLEAELAYGVAGFGGAGTVTPYGGLTLDGTDTARYRLGGRVALGSSLDLSVEGHRTEQDDAPASHGLSAQLGLRW